MGTNVTGGFFSSDLFSIYNVLQNTQIIFPKELIIGKLREFFAKDSKYHYVKDAWGFPKTPDHTDLNVLSGLNDDETTRIYIGAENRSDIVFYPNILIKSGGTTFSPISFNDDNFCVTYENRLFVDNSGNETTIQVPVNFYFSGAWDISLTIDVQTEGPNDRSTLVELVSVYLQSIARTELTLAGLFIKSLRVDGETSEIYQNRNIYKQSITVDCRGEFSRICPIYDYIDVINLCVQVGSGISTNQFAPCPNLDINYQFDLTDLPFYND